MRRPERQRGNPRALGCRDEFRPGIRSQTRSRRGRSMGRDLGLSPPQHGHDRDRYDAGWRISPTYPVSARTWPARANPLFDFRRIGAAGIVARPVGHEPRSSRSNQPEDGFLRYKPLPFIKRIMTNREDALAD